MRRLVIALALVLWWASPASATYALCSSTTAAFGVNGGTTSGINTATSCGGSTAANLITMIISECSASSCGGPVDQTPSDSLSNSWSQCGTTQTFGETAVSIWFVEAPSTGASQTFSYNNGAISYSAVVVAAWSGSVASPCDKSNGTATGGVNSLSTGSVTPANNSLVLAGGSFGNGECNGDSLAVSGYTSIATTDYGGGVNEGVGGFYILSNGTATNPAWTWTTASDVSVAVATFKVPVSGGSCVPTMSLLGISSCG